MFPGNIKMYFYDLSKSISMQQKADIIGDTTTQIWNYISHSIGSKNDIFQNHIQLWEGVRNLVWVYMSRALWLRINR